MTDLLVKIGLITKLTRDLNTLGKTAIMKLLYLLQEVYNVSCRYTFSLYTYGPYCAEVLSDLDYAEAIGVVDINHVAYSSSITGYEVKPTSVPMKYPSSVTSFLEKNNESIKEVERFFGKLNAKQLELRSTIIYICKRNIENVWQLDLEGIAQSVQEVKPHFSIEEIKVAYHELNENGILAKLNTNTK